MKCCFPGKRNWERDSFVCEGHCASEDNIWIDVSMFPCWYWWSSPLKLQNIKISVTFYILRETSVVSPLLNSPRAKRTALCLLPVKGAQIWSEAIHPSIHPSILIRLSRGRVAGAADPAGWPRLPSRPQHFPAHSGGSRGVPRPAGRCNPSSASWVFPGVSSQLDVPGKPLMGGVQV